MEKLVIYDSLHIPLSIHGFTIILSKFWIRNSSSLINFFAREKTGCNWNLFFLQPTYLHFCFVFYLSQHPGPFPIKLGARNVCLQISIGFGFAKRRKKERNAISV